MPQKRSAKRPTIRRLFFTPVTLDGDIIIVVGMDKHQIIVQVHSAILRAASPSFAAVFGINSQSDVPHPSPRTFEMTQSDPEAIWRICKALHFQQDSLGSHPITAATVFNIAQLANKYFLVQALQYRARDWLQAVSSSEVEDMWLMAKAAYLLRDDASFSMFSSNLMYLHVGSYRVLLEQDDCLIGIESKLVALLEDLRANLRQVLIKRASLGNVNGHKFVPTMTLTMPPIASPPDENELSKMSVMQFIDKHEHRLFRIGWKAAAQNRDSKGKFILDELRAWKEPISLTLSQLHHPSTLERLKRNTD